MKFLLLFLISTMVYAQNIVYITEKLEVPLRIEPSFDAQIEKMLVTGTKMTLLERSSEGWAKIENEGIIGWVTSHYITNNEPAYIQLAQLKTQYQALSQKHLKITEKLKLVRKYRNEYKTKYLKYKLTANKMRKEGKYMRKTFKSALSLDSDNQKLIQKNLTLQAQIKLLEENKVSNKDKSAQNWFMVGGFILFLGVILGALLPKIFAPKTRQRGF